MAIRLRAAAATPQMEKMARSRLAAGLGSLELLVAALGAPLMTPYNPNGFLHAALT